ncbi:MAG TPA: carbon-nitrogen hydrolase family protein [Acidobacteriota bacterium]|nr:carbon-nitrogen hydrolase family protein [Acidobacteriota bacterium]
MLIAAVQLRSTDQVESNLNRVASLVAEAAHRGAALVALPENFAYLRSEGEDIGYHQSLDGELADWLKQLAQKHGISLLAGSFPETAPNQKVFNTSLLFGPDGQRLALYRKVHLFDVTLPDGTVLEESRFVEPGQELVTVTIDDVCFGLSICYDLRFPELYRQLTAQGAQVLFIPAAFTLQTGKDHWEILLRARAIENQVYVVAPAQFGQHTPKRASYGRAMIIDPWGMVLATAPDRECFIMAEIDTSHLARIRKAMPCLLHRRM